MTKKQDQANRAAFGARLQKARNKKGLSQHEFAAKAAISRSQIVNIECGRSWPKPSRLGIFARILGVSLDHLFGNRVRSKEAAAK